MLNSDVYGSDDDIDFLRDADFNKISNKLNNDGYRIGKSKEDEKQVQLGFDSGFSDGILLGKALGRLYGIIRYYLKEKESSGNSKESIDQILTACEVLFFEDIPEKRRPIVDIVTDLKNLVAGINEPALDLEVDRCMKLLGL